MTKLLSLLLFVFLLTGCGEADKGDTAVTPTASANVVKIKAEMDCGGCARKVKKALYQFPGIKNVKTDLDNQTVLIEVSDKNLFNLENAEAKIHEATCDEEEAAPAEATE